jgi:long-chain acyl-CoA synthetase
MEMFVINHVFGSVNSPSESGSLDWDRSTSIGDYFEAASDQFADQIALSDKGAMITYKQLGLLTRDFAAYLQNLPSMKKGDRVALMMPNLLQYPLAMLGAIRAGFVVVTINPFYTPSELQHQLRDSGAKAIVVLDGYLNQINKVIKQTPVEYVVLTSVDEMHSFSKKLSLNLFSNFFKKWGYKYKNSGVISFKQAIKRGQSNELRSVSIGQDDLAFLHYTDCEAGSAKGVMISHGNTLANIAQIGIWLEIGRNGEKEFAVQALPPNQMFYLLINFLAFLKMGGHCFLISEFDNVNAILKSLARRPFTVLIGVSNLFERLLEASFKQIDFSSLKLTLSADGTQNLTLADRWKKMTQIKLSNFYGVAEATLAVCVNPWEQAMSGSSGLPLPFTEISVRDSEFNQLQTGQVGFLYVKGPQVMRGYWNRPRETSEVLRQDGWLKMGALASLDEKGYCYIHHEREPNST